MMATKRHVLALLATLALACGITLIACGGDDEPAPAEVADAASEGGDASSDPCDTFTGSGKACSVPAGKICFPQCTNGGCFCQNGVWACRTDKSCDPDGSPLQDVVTPPEDANVEDTGSDAEDASDASDDGATDATDDASDASDAPLDAEDAG